MKEEIQQRQARRFTLLYLLYKETKADTNKIVDLDTIAASHNLKNGLFSEAYDYLKEEKLIVNFGTRTYSASITHAGKKIVEKIVTYPNELIEGFPAFNNMNL